MKFLEPAKVKLLDNFHFETLEDIDMPMGNDHSTVIRVPAGFRTDLASVPRPLWSIFPPHGRYAKAAIVHDYLLSRCDCSCKATYKRQRSFADDAFFLAMLQLNVPIIKAKALKLAVQARSAWRVATLKEQT